MAVKSSILTVTYNSDHRLELFLAGFLNQTEKNFEIVIVNDGAPRVGAVDKTKVLVDSFNPFLDIRYVYLEPESTEFRLSQALNLGLRNVSTENLIFCGSDCVPNPNVVRIMSEHARDDRIVLGVRKRIHKAMVPYLNRYDLPNLDRLVKEEDRRLWDPKYAPLFKQLQDAAPLDSWNLAWTFLLSGPTWKFKALGGFDERLIGWGGEDQDMAERLVRAMGCKFLAMPEAFVYHLDHVDRQSNLYVNTLAKIREDWTPIRNGGPIA